MRYLTFLFFLNCVFSQQNLLNNEDIWNYEFEQKSYKSIYHFKTKNYYSTIEISHNQKKSKIVLRSYETGKIVEVILDSSSSAKIPFFTNYFFSADERKIILETNSYPLYRRSKLAEYYIYDTQNDEISYVFNGLIQEPFFSPDGEKVAFIYNRNLYIKFLKNNVIKQITFTGSENILNAIADWVYEEEFGMVRAFDWDKDSNNLAYVVFDETNVPEYSMKIFGNNLYPFQYNFKYPKAGEVNSSLDLKIYNLESDKSNRVDFSKNLNDYYYIPRLKFSPFSNKLYIQSLNRLQNKLTLSTYNLDLGIIKTVFEEKDDTYVDIQQKLFLLKNDSFLWLSDRSGFDHIYLVENEGKNLKQITRGNWDVAKLLGINNTTIYYSSTEDNSIERVIYSISLNGKNKKAISPKTGFNGASFTSNYKYFIHTFEDKNTPLIYSLRDSKSGKLVRKILDNNELLEKINPFNLSYKDFSKINLNGEELNMWMIKPPNFNPKKKYPLLIYQYSGPGSQEVENRWSSNRDLWHQMLAQKDFIIACLDGRGTGFKGKKFKKMTYRQLAKYETEDQISFAKYLSKFSYIDKDRIGIWGWSYGGLISTNSILKGNDIFSLAIAVAPVTNWRFYDTIYTERFMGLPKDNSEGYDLNSPLNFAHLLEGDYLLIHGSADDNVHLQNTMRMVEELIQEDKQFEWMIYPDKNHGIYGGNTSIHLYNKMTNFIEKKL
ncbi:MAG: S9 family peptidase [Flavobacteriaceae bacterium]